MTTLTEIAELRAEMDAKFERVYGELAEIKSEQHGMAEDIKELRQEMHQNLQEINSKLDSIIQLLP